MSKLLSLPLSMSRTLGLAQDSDNTPQPQKKEDSRTKETDANGADRPNASGAHRTTQGNNIGRDSDRLASTSTQHNEVVLLHDNSSALSTDDWEMLIQTIIDDYEDEIAYIESRKVSGLVEYTVGTVASAAIFAVTAQNAISFYNPFAGLQHISGRDSLLVWCLLLLFFSLGRIYTHLKNDESLEWSDGVFSTTYATILYAVPALTQISVCRGALFAIVSIVFARLTWIVIQQRRTGVSVTAISALPATRHVLYSAMFAVGVLVPLTLSGVLYEAKADLTNQAISPAEEKALVESGIADGGYTDLQEWVDFAQHIVNVEARHLGFSEDEIPVVKATLMDDRAGAGYNPLVNTIHINIRYVVTADDVYSYRFLAHQMCHELAHAMQYRRVFYNRPSPDESAVFDDLDEGTVEQWRRELLLYPILSYNVDGYFSLDVERSAEKYANRRIEEYEANSQSELPKHAIV